ncbi:flagellar associated protein 46 [Acrasis kona]|uniref:Flagellar associated protein 46 n=1 Tax=Acrasis kona TaxID=1008807 RepID=A0AAW2YP15_9EUKA
MINRDTRYLDLCVQVQQLLQPILDGFIVDLKKITNKRIIVVTNDELLMDLPIEVCLDSYCDDNGIQRFNSISRDFSVAFLIHRLSRSSSSISVSSSISKSKSSAPVVPAAKNDKNKANASAVANKDAIDANNAPSALSMLPCGVDWEQIRYIVDPFGEDYKLLTEKFERDMASVSSTWQGIKWGGKDVASKIPNIYEIQKLIQDSTCFYYHGFDTLLEHIMHDASHFSNLNLKNLELAIVMDRGAPNHRPSAKTHHNTTTTRRASTVAFSEILQNDDVKTPASAQKVEDEQVEGLSLDYETLCNIHGSWRLAAIASMLGTQTIVTNLFVPSDSIKNLDLCAIIMSELITQRITNPPNQNSLSSASLKSPSSLSKKPPTNKTTQPNGSVTTFVGKSITAVRRSRPPGSHDNTTIVAYYNPIVYGIA